MAQLLTPRVHDPMSPPSWRAKPERARPRDRASQDRRIVDADLNGDIAACVRFEAELAGAMRARRARKMDVRARCARCRTGATRVSCVSRKTNLPMKKAALRRIAEGKGAQTVAARSRARAGKAGGEKLARKTARRPRRRSVKSGAENSAARRSRRRKRVAAGAWRWPLRLTCTAIVLATAQAAVIRFARRARRGSHGDHRHWRRPRGGA